MRGALTFSAVTGAGVVLARCVHDAGVPSAHAFILGMGYMIAVALLLNTRREAA